MLQGNDLGLNKEIAERGMQRVCIGGGQNHFRVTRDVDRPALQAAVGDGDSSQFNVIFGGNGHIAVGVKVMVMPAKFGSPFGKNRLKTLGPFERRLEGC